MKARPFAVFLLLCVIWGSTWAAISIVVHQVPPLRSAALRFSAAGLVLLGVAVVSRSRWPNSRELRSVAVMCVTMFALPYGLIFWAEQHISSGMTAVLYAAMPLLTGLISASAVYGKRVPRAAMNAMFFGWGGIAVIVSGAISTSWSQAAGVAAVLVAVVSQSYSAILAKRALATVSPVTGTALQFIGGGLCLSVASAAFERNMPSLWTRSAAGAMAFLVVLGSVLAFSLYFWLLQQVEPYQATAMNLIVPVVAVAEGALFLHDPLDAWMIAGTVVVLVSVGIALRVPQNEDATLTLSVENETAAP